MNKQEYLDTLKHFLSIKSVSTDHVYAPDMAQARHFLKDIFSQMDFTVKILKGEKHDAVFAQCITDPKLPTVLIYGHYDVQPPEPLEEWATPPFEPTVKNGQIFARGATDNKGQVMIHIMGVKSLIEKPGANLPANFKFLVEGEEEIGSPSVEPMLREHKDLLKCDYMFVSDTEMAGKNQPSLDISLRGLLYTEVEIRTARHDLHSGQFGGVAENPAIVLARIIAELKDSSGRVNIPKFYDDVVPPSKQELDAYKTLGTNQKQIIEEGALFGIGGGEAWYPLNQRRWARPTLDVNGIVSGYTGEGSKTIIPAKSCAKISMRLVPNQNLDIIYTHFVKLVRNLAPKTCKVKITRHADCLPYKAPIHHPVFDKVRQSLEKAFGKKPMLLGTGGSIGFIPVAAKALKVPCVLVGFGLPDDNLHAPNEHFLLENYYKGIETMTDLYQNLTKNTNRE